MASDVKWIKITTDIFDDEKILLIEALPDAYAIITCWFKLLCMAGKQNNGGVFLMCGRIAYTEQMLATIFRMKETTVSMALKTFQNFGMIEILDGVITIPNWSKHQSLDSLEKRREAERLRQQKHRAAQKLLCEEASDCHVTNDVTSRESSPSPSISPSNSCKDNKGSGEKKEPKHKHGSYGNVLLTDAELRKLQEEFPSDWDKRIDRLSEYIASTGKSYKSHLATIRSWARRDHETQPRGAAPRYQAQQSSNVFMDMLREEEGQ